MHPGWVATDMTRGEVCLFLPALGSRFGLRFGSRLSSSSGMSMCWQGDRTTDEGAATAVELATLPAGAVEPRGGMLLDMLEFGWPR